MKCNKPENFIIRDAETQHNFHLRLQVSVKIEHSQSKSDMKLNIFDYAHAGLTDSEYCSAAREICYSKLNIVLGTNYSQCVLYHGSGFHQCETILSLKSLTN